MEISYIYIVCVVAAIICSIAPATHSEDLPRYKQDHLHQVTWLRIARCQTQCVTSLLPSKISHCEYSPVCHVCWETCEHLVTIEGYVDEMCESGNGDCVLGCRTACDAIQKQNQKGIIAANYRLWSFPQMTQVKITSPKLHLLSWHRPSLRTDGVVHLNDDVIVYVILNKLSRHQTWKQLCSTTQLSAVAKVSETQQEDVSYRILAVGTEGLLANMDSTVLHRDMYEQKLTETVYVSGDRTALSMNAPDAVDMDIKLTTETQPSLSSPLFILTLIICLMPPFIFSMIVIMLCVDRYVCARITCNLSGWFSRRRQNNIENVENNMINSNQLVPSRPSRLTKNKSLGLFIEVINNTRASLLSLNVTSLVKPGLKWGKNTQSRIPYGLLKPKMSDEWVDTSKIFPCY